MRASSGGQETAFYLHCDLNYHFPNPSVKTKKKKKKEKTPLFSILAFGCKVEVLSSKQEGSVATNCLGGRTSIFHGGRRSFLSGC